MKKQSALLKINWKVLIFSIISFLLVLFVCFYQLANLTDHKLSQPELTAIESASSGKVIWNNPLLLPFKLLIYVVIKLGFGSVLGFRAVSALFGVSLVVFFYLLAKLWFSSKIAWVGTAMLLTSGLFLNFTRLATADVLVPLGLLGLLWSAWWVFQNKRTNLRLALSIFIVSASFYIPGLIWFTVLIVFVQRKHLNGILKRTSKAYISVALFTMFILLAPLLRAIIINPIILKEWLAIPTNFSISQFITDFIYVPASLAVRAPINPIYNVGRLPYLDVLTIGLIILGVYAFLLRLDLVRTRTLIGSIIIAWLLIALKNMVYINLLLPLIYITVSAGIMFMLQQWYGVFPKNPIARTLGMILLLAVISISLFYNTTRYFIVWANNPLSKQSFQSKPPTNLVQ